MAKEEQPGRGQRQGWQPASHLNRNLAEILESYPVNLASMTDEITKSLKFLEGIMKEGRKRSILARRWNVTKRWHNGALKLLRHQQAVVAV